VRFAETVEQLLKETGGGTPEIASAEGPAHGSDDGTGPREAGGEES